MTMKSLSRLLISSALILVLIVCGCTSSSDSAPDEKTPQETQAQTMLTAFEAYDLAAAAAAAEYGSVYLEEMTAGGGTVGLTSLYEKVDDSGRAASWELLFLQPGDGTYVRIIVDVADGEVTSTWAGDPHEMSGGWDSYQKYSVVDIERCQITGAEAVRIADGDGGCDYTRIMLRLVNGSAGRPHWIVAYGPATGQKGELPGVTYHIDGETGEIVSKKTKTYNVF